MQSENPILTLVPIELTKFNLVWDVGYGYISTFCDTSDISQEVFTVLQSHNISAHLMQTDARIIVIYLHNMQ